MCRSENLPDHILRTTQADAFFGFDQRPVDQDRVLDHGVENVIFADVGARQAELLGQRFLGAQALAGR